MDRERAANEDRHDRGDGHRHLNREGERQHEAERSSDPIRFDGGPAPTAPGPASRRSREADESPTWLQIMVPTLVVLLLATLVMLWNIVAAVVILVLGVGVILSWIVQKKEPHQPGE